MNEAPMNQEIFFKTLPREWQPEIFSKIKERLSASGIKTVILDDDPTGTQTVHGLNVLTTWGVEELTEELLSDAAAFFILTNSRSMTSSEAAELSFEIGMNLKSAMDQTGTKIRVISRSDSTLRGHFPDEMEPLAKALGQEERPYLLVPFFLEGHRYTYNDIHWVGQDGMLIPAAQTAYAKDSYFGFSNSNLSQWVEEKTRSKIKSDQVTCVSLDDIRKKGPQKVADVLSKTEKNTACIVNAVSYKDIEVLVLALLELEKKGFDFIYRTAASFVRVMTGTTPRKALISKAELAQENSNGGLFVVGSYVPKTTFQLNALLDKTSIEGVEINVTDLLDESRRQETIRKTSASVNLLIKDKKDVVLYTSRKLIQGKDSGSSLEIGKITSDSLISIVKNIQSQPRYLVAKGGITSSDIATRALNVKKALIMGQALPGIPVWKLGNETLYPGMALIIFPGNVGDDDGLVKIKQEMEN